MPSEIANEIDDLTPEAHPDDLSVGDVEKLENYLDVNINPDAHLSVQIFKAQASLDSENLHVAHAKFFQHICLLESMCRGWGRLPDTYDADILSYMNSAEYTSLGTDAQMMQLSHKKLILILTKMSESQKMQGRIKV